MALQGGSVHGITPKGGASSGNVRPSLVRRRSVVPTASMCDAIAAGEEMHLSLRARGDEIRAEKAARRMEMGGKRRAGEMDQIPTSDMFEMLERISMAGTAGRASGKSPKSRSSAQAEGEGAAACQAGAARAEETLSLSFFDQDELVTTKCLRFIGRWATQETDEGQRAVRNQQLSFDSGATAWVLQGVALCERLLKERIAAAAIALREAGVAAEQLAEAQNRMRECEAEMEDVESQEAFAAKQKDLIQAEKLLEKAKEEDEGASGEAEDTQAASDELEEELEACCRAAGQIVSQNRDAKNAALRLDVPAALMRLARQDKHAAIKRVATGAVGQLAAGHEGLQDRLRERGALDLFMRHLRLELRRYENEEEEGELPHYWGAHMHQICTTLCHLVEENPTSAKHLRTQSGEEDATLGDDGKEQEPKQGGQQKNINEGMGGLEDDDEEEEDLPLTGFEMVASALVDKRLRDRQFEERDDTRLVLLRIIAACSEPAIEVDADADDDDSLEQLADADDKGLLPQIDLAKPQTAQTGGKDDEKAQGQTHKKQRKRLVMSIVDPLRTCRARYAEIAAIPCRDQPLRRALRFGLRAPNSLMCVETARAVTNFTCCEDDVDDGVRGLMAEFIRFIRVSLEGGHLALLAKEQREAEDDFEDDEEEDEDGDGDGSGNGEEKDSQTSDDESGKEDDEAIAMKAAQLAAVERQRKLEEEKPWSLYDDDARVRACVECLRGVECLLSAEPFCQRELVKVGGLSVLLQLLKDVYASPEWKPSMAALQARAATVLALVMEGEPRVRDALCKMRSAPYNPADLDDEPGEPPVAKLLDIRNRAPALLLALVADEALPVELRTQACMALRECLLDNDDLIELMGGARGRAILQRQAAEGRANLGSGMRLGGGTFGAGNVERSMADGGEVLKVLLRCMLPPVSQAEGKCDGERDQEDVDPLDSLRLAATYAVEPIATSWRLNHAVAIGCRVVHGSASADPNAGMGGLALLTAIIGDHTASERCRAAAADAMSTLCDIRFDQSLKNRRRAREVGALEALVDLVHCHGCHGVEAQTLVCGHEPDIGGQWEVRRWALGAEQVTYGQCRQSALRALGVLVNIDDENKREVKRLGGIPVLVALAGASCSVEETRNYAVLCLTQLCTAATQDAMRQNGAILALVKHRLTVLPDDETGTNGEVPSPESRTWAVQCLTRICKDTTDKLGLRGYFPNQEQARHDGAIEALLALLKIADEPLQLSAVACLRMLLNQNEATIAHVFACGGDSALVDLASDVQFSATGDVRTAAAECMASMGVGAPDPNDTPRPSPRNLYVAIDADED